MDERRVASEGKRRLDARGQYDVEPALRAQYDLDTAGREIAAVLGPQHPFLSDFVERVGRKRFLGRPEKQESIVPLVVQRHPFALGDGSGTKALPMDHPFTDLKPPDILEEQQGNRTFQPFIEVLLDLSVQKRVGDLHFDPSGSRRQAPARDPVRFGEPIAFESDSQCRRKQLDPIAQAEGALEADPSEADRVKRALVGVTEPADRREVSLDEILAIVLEHKTIVFDRHARLAGASIVGVLKQLGKDMARALHLLEQLMPRTRKFWVRLKLIPAFRRALPNLVEVIRRRGGKVGEVPDVAHDASRSDPDFFRLTRYRYGATSSTTTRSPARARCN
ncbi:hypothetical protein NKH98_17780 [Mesorhizobium sp. M0833]|uniref:hypothetical protein n=1 Tax=Mesorhizobium sp. M0833 TaxID=2957009 RepID=UPI00333887CF